VVSGATIGGKASLNRTAHVKTFEYRPLHNSKRVNLIITVSGYVHIFLWHCGWMVWLISLSVGG